ncbi:MAG TPA: RNA polymerase sigma factor [Bacteroidia bacterium]
MTEESLIEGCISGKREFQELLYRQYSGKMLAICCRYVRSREEAEDIAQEAFVKVFRNIHTFQRLGPLENWIKRIMVNTALAYLRKQKRGIDFADIDHVKHHPHSEQDTLSDINAKDLVALVQNLPSGYRAVFNLFVMEGYSHEEIAAMLGISEGTSKSQLAKARNWLKKNINANLSAKSGQNLTEAQTK